jgi:hypothetical protein
VQAVKRLGLRNKQDSARESGNEAHRPVKRHELVEDSRVDDAAPAQHRVRGNSRAQDDAEPIVGTVRDPQRLHQGLPERLPILVDEPGVAESERVIADRGAEQSQLGPVPHIVLVGKGNQSSARSGQQLFQPADLAAIALGFEPDHPAIPGAVGIENGHAVVCRTIVDDKQFKVREILAKDRIDLVAEESGSVVGRQEDRDFWHRWSALLASHGSIKGAGPGLHCE